MEKVKDEELKELVMIHYLKMYHIEKKDIQKEFNVFKSRSSYFIKFSR